MSRVAGWMLSMVDTVVLNTFLKQVRRFNFCERNTETQRMLKKYSRSPRWTLPF